MTSEDKKITPMVSILLITYNHEKYIGQAIESILEQETEYSFVINVIEDCSTDKTQEVVMRYVEKYPDKVVPYFNKENIGYKVTQKNFIRGLRTMNGKYWAVLEGDDYWNSPHKLQKQIDFLEANAEFAACGHNTIKIYEDGSKEPHLFLSRNDLKEVHTIDDLILIESFFHTSSMMYRNVYQGNPPSYFENPWSCDIFINIAHAQFGNFRFFNDDMSVYRAHEGGRFSNMKILEGWLFNIGGLCHYNAWLEYRYLRIFSKSIARYCSVVLRGAGRDGVTPLTIKQWFKYMAMRAMYLTIYYAIELPQKAWHYSKYFLPTSLREKKPLRAVAFAATLPPFLFICGVLFILKLMMTTLRNLTLSIATPERRAKLLEFESQFSSVKHLRLTLLYGNIFSREGFTTTKNAAKEITKYVMKKCFNIDCVSLKNKLKKKPRDI